MAFLPKEVKIGKLHSIALSDGEYVSHNFETPNRVMVEGFTRFDIVQINSAHVMKDMIGLDAIELTSKRGESADVNKPILGVYGILHQKFFYRLNLIFWIVMGCGIALFGRRGLTTAET